MQKSEMIWNAILKITFDYYFSPGFATILGKGTVSVIVAAEMRNTLISFFFFCFFVCFVFLWLHPQHMEVPGPGIDLSHSCNNARSFNLLCQARD